MCYENGTGVEKDATEAVTWYRKAAEQGNDDAQYALGVCYEEGLGGVQSWRLAVKLYLKAFESECNKNKPITSLDSLSTHDFSSPAARCLHAAEQGNVDAQYALGCLYKEGCGVEADMKKAKEWYRKAAKQGDAEARKILLDCLGEDSDKPEAVTTDCQVNVEAQYEIGDHGEYYYKDNGDELDLRKAMDVSFTVKSKATN